MLFYFLLGIEPGIWILYSGFMPRNKILESWFSPFRIPFVSNEISDVILESLVDDVPPNHTRK